MIIISEIGYLLRIFTLTHSNVPIDTMIISPVSAAIGSRSTKDAPNMINMRRPTEATIPERRARAPLEIFIRLCPIMAQPPIPEKNPDVIFAIPWATASLFVLPLVSVISSISSSVNRLSMSPTLGHHSCVW